MTHRLLTISLVAALAVGMSACSTVKDQLGMSKQTPDEFEVVTRAPLTLPPDYALRPPAPGARRPQEADVRDQAAEKVFEATIQNQAKPAAAKPGNIESLLLTNTDGKVAPNIRQQVDQEAGGLTAEEESIVDDILFWRPKQNADELVDPAAEKKRIQENLSQGKPVTEGETPTIKPSSRGILDAINN